MTSQPAASVPWGVDELGLPRGVQLVGRTGAEPDVIRASRVVEAAAAGSMPPPPLLRTCN
jgi:Asp-tRNA(Asn)/Glu-tRNA(Gln) amidotransferase A subunit family amidase